MQKKHIHCIGIGGIGISALARYYLAQGYHITGTNLGRSALIDALEKEGIEIVADGASVIGENTVKVIYTEAIIDDHALGLDGVRDVHQAEIRAAQSYHIPILSYPEALAEVLHTFPMKIAVAGAHGKSTTSAMIGTILHDLHASATTVTGTLLKAFNGKNVSAEGNEIMNIEACEYRNAFLNYKPDIAVITNIDPDHLDFFKTEQAYQEAFSQFIGQSRCIVILASEFDKLPVIPESLNASEAAGEMSGIQVNTLSHSESISGKGINNNLDSGSDISLTSSMKTSVRNDGRTFVIVHSDHFELLGDSFNGIEPGKYSFHLPSLLVPGDHIRLDAELAYVVSQLLGLDAEASKKSLAQYPGSWRRMEVIGTTKNLNLVMSDYGHHPTEIIATLCALKKAHPDKKLIVFFEPHQYSRTYELREEFATSFGSADMLYISDIYAARDIDERRDMINSKILADMVAKNSPCEYVGTLDDARKKLQIVDAEEKNSLLLLLGAGNIDNLRDVLKY